MEPPQGTSSGRAGAGKASNGSAESIAVVIRIRPPQAQEQARGAGGRTWQYDDTSICMIGENDKKVGNGFTFDRVFPPEAANEDLYDDFAADIVQRTAEGINATIFAYGQTSSGKTHTMSGTEGSPGLIPLSVKEIFASVARQREEYEAKRASLGDAAEACSLDLTVSVSYLEIYNEKRSEKLTDLLVPIQAAVPTFGGGGGMSAQQQQQQQQQALSIVGRNGGFVVDGLSEVTVSNVDEVMDVKARGDKRRITGATDMNQTSSRSHALFTVTVRRKEILNGDYEEEQAEEKGSSDVTSGVPDAGGRSRPRTRGHRKNSALQKGSAIRLSRLTLVDLAGSERIANTGTDGLRMREGIGINSSLHNLGLVINRLSNGEQHVPFRGSALTKILQSALSGNSKTGVVCAITPAGQHMDESISTLNFASRAKFIETKPVVNETADAGAILQRYVQRVKELELTVHRAEQAVVERDAKVAAMTRESEEYVQNLMEENDIQVVKLRSKLKMLQEKAFSGLFRVNWTPAASRQSVHSATHATPSLYRHREATDTDKHVSAAGGRCLHRTSASAHTTPVATPSQGSLRRDAAVVSGVYRAAGMETNGSESSGTSMTPDRVQANGAAVSELDALQQAVEERDGALAELGEALKTASTEAEAAMVTVQGRLVQVQERHAAAAQERDRLTSERKELTHAVDELRAQLQELQASVEHDAVAYHASVCAEKERADVSDARAALVESALTEVRCEMEALRVASVEEDAPIPPVTRDASIQASGAGLTSEDMERMKRLLKVAVDKASTMDAEMVAYKDALQVQNELIENLAGIVDESNTNVADACPTKNADVVADDNSEGGLLEGSKARAHLVALAAARTVTEQRLMASEDALSDAQAAAALSAIDTEARLHQVEESSKQLVVRAKAEAQASVQEMEQVVADLKKGHEKQLLVAIADAIHATEREQEILLAEAGAAFEKKTAVVAGELEDTRAAAASHLQAKEALSARVAALEEENSTLFAKLQNFVEQDGQVNGKEAIGDPGTSEVGTVSASPTNTSLATTSLSGLVHSSAAGARGGRCAVADLQQLYGKVHEQRVRRGTVGCAVAREDMNVGDENAVPLSIGGVTSVASKATHVACSGTGASPQRALAKHPAIWEGVQSDIAPSTIAQSPLLMRRREPMAAAAEANCTTQ